MDRARREESELAGISKGSAEQVHLITVKINNGLKTTGRAALGRTRVLG